MATVWLQAMLEPAGHPGSIDASRDYLRLADNAENLILSA
jgi:hypothetical protein